MTSMQRAAIELMRDANLGAVLVDEFGWVWPQTIRESHEVAVAVVARLS